MDGTNAGTNSRAHGTRETEISGVRAGRREPTLGCGRNASPSTLIIQPPGIKEHFRPFLSSPEQNKSPPNSSLKTTANAPRTPGVPASCWQFSAKAKTSQQGASTPRVRSAPGQVREDLRLGRGRANPRTHKLPHETRRALSITPNQLFRPPRSRPLQRLQSQSVSPWPTEMRSWGGYVPDASTASLPTLGGAKRGLGAEAPCWLDRAFAENCQHEASAPRPRFAASHLRASA